MTAAILALTIFVLMFILIVTEKFELGIGFWRCHARLGCCMENTELRRDRYSGLLVSCRRFRESIDGYQLGYDIFIAGMMVMVEGMAASGFFSRSPAKLSITRN